MPTSSTTNVKPLTGKVPALAGTIFLLRERPGEREQRHNHAEPAEQHVKAERRVIPRRVGVEAGEGAAVVARAGSVGVKHFAQAVRAVVVQAGLAPVAHRRPGRETENDEGENDERQQRHFHVVGLDFFAEIFRRAPDHQPGDEHGEDDENQHAVKSRADAAENHLAGLDVEQRHQPAERREGVVHGIDRAAGGVGRHRGEQRGIENAEADFLAFHVAVGGGDAELLMNRIAAALPPTSKRERRRET